MASVGYFESQNVPLHTKYNYLQIRKDHRIKRHPKGTYPKRKEVKGNLGPIVDLGAPDKKREKLADLEMKEVKGKEKQIAKELVMLGFHHTGNSIFMKDNKYYVDLNSKEVKRKQKSYPKDTKIPFKNIVIPTTLNLLPKGYLCSHTLKNIA